MTALPKTPHSNLRRQINYFLQQRGFTSEICALILKQQHVHNKLPTYTYNDTNITSFVAL